jgi:uncharacterized SAM-binding protein YcdF (DUF218 family)
MYFDLSKTLGFVAVPSNLVMLIIIFGLLLWRSRYARFGRRITVAGIVLLLIGGATPVGTALLLPLENRFPRWDQTRGAPDGVVVLGGVVNTYISRRRNEIAVGPSTQRLLATVDLYRQYPNARIVFSGGNPSLVFAGSPESDLAVPFLEHWGVPAGDIGVDDAARDTMENALNAKRIAAPKPGERWLLVTSAFHMPRAIGLFRAAGFPVEAYPVDWKTGGWRDILGLPSSLIGGFGRLDVAAHEWEGLLVDWLIGRSSTLFPAPAHSASAG